MNNRASETKSNFESSVEKTVFRYKMIEEKDKVVVALSGGADSVSLLLSLRALAEKLSFSLFACHLNHMIRKETAVRDEEFSKALCDTLSIPFYSERVDIPAICEREKGSLETVARNARYNFFERAKAHFCAQRVATAHTMSDNAETVLFNLTRGTGTDGICGIPPKRDYFIRPLIHLSRQEVEEYLDACGQSFVTDETNSDEEYSRNFLRKNVIPQLKKLNPNLEDAIFRLSEGAREDREYFLSVAKDLAKEKMSAKELSFLPQPLLKRYIRQLFSKSAECAFLSGKNADDIAKAIFSTACDKKKRRICLSSKISAEISPDGLCFLNESESIGNEKEDRFFDIPLVCGENIINEKYAVFMTAQKDQTLPLIIKKQDIVYKLYKKAALRSDIIDNSVFVRPRQEKDVFRLGGISRKLKKVFADMKIPQDERHLVPIVYTKSETAKDTVLCLPLFSAPCDHAKAREDEDAAVIAFYRS